MRNAIVSAYLWCGGHPKRLYRAVTFPIFVAMFFWMAWEIVHGQLTL